MNLRDTKLGSKRKRRIWTRRKFHRNVPSWKLRFYHRLREMVIKLQCFLQVDGPDALRTRLSVGLAQQQLLRLEIGLRFTCAVLVHCVCHQPWWIPQLGHPSETSTDSRSGCAHMALLIWIAFQTDRKVELRTALAFPGLNSAAKGVGGRGGGRLSWIVAASSNLSVPKHALVRNLFQTMSVGVQIYLRIRCDLAWFFLAAATELFLLLVELRPALLLSA